MILEMSIRILSGRFKLAKRTDLPIFLEAVYSLSDSSDAFLGADSLHFPGIN